MAYIQSLDVQIVIFLKTVAFGFLLGIGYDFVRLLRLCIASGKGILLWDIFYGIFSAVLFFLFDLIVDGGRVRAFMLLAEAVGFFAWYFLAGVPMRRLGAKLEFRISRIKEHLARPVTKVEQRAEKCRKTIHSKAKFFCKKIKIPLEIVSWFGV